MSKPCTVHIALAALMLALAGCTPLHPPTEASASIRWACSGCLPQQPVGYASITVTLYAESPENAQYSWDFGDGTNATGRFVTHEYTTEGLYKVTLTALVKRGIAEKLFRATTYFKVLAPPMERKNEISVATELYTVTFLVPKALALGETSQICFVVSPKRTLVVLDFVLAESPSLLGEGKFEGTWLYLTHPQEHCAAVERFNSGSAWIEYNIFGATDDEGKRITGRITLGAEETTSL